MGIDGHGHVALRALAVSAEIAAGGLVFVVAAFIVARPVVLDLLGLLRSVLKRREVAARVPSAA